MPDEANPAVETADGTPPKKLCGAVKYGAVALYCAEPAGHEPAWHKARVIDHREISYSSSHHAIHTVETVRWEPVDHAGEATRHILAGRRGTG